MKTRMTMCVAAMFVVAGCPEEINPKVRAMLAEDAAGGFETVNAPPAPTETDVPTTPESDAADGSADAGPTDVGTDAGDEGAVEAPEVNTDITPEGDAQVSPDESGAEAGTPTPDEGPSGEAGAQPDEGGEGGAGADEGTDADAGEELAEVAGPGPSFGCTSAFECDDGNVCTKDACDNGACLYSLVSCLDANACTDDICVPESGCIHAPFLESEVCDGGKTMPAACVAGVCTFIVEAEPCVPDCAGKNCGANGCGGSCGTCEAGTECIAGICTAAEEPECSGAGDPVCNDGNQCTEDGCSSGKCTHTPLVASCNDGNACTTGEACSSGICTGGQPITCTGANPCMEYGCQPAEGCVGDSKPAGTQCGEPGSDFVVTCNAAAECVKTVTEGPPGGGEPPPESACMIDADCTDDGNSCTDEVCGTDDNGEAACLSVQFVCDDANPCTKDSCHGAAESPQCLIEPVGESDPCGVMPNGEPKTCQSGVCEPVMAGCVPDCGGKSCGSDGCGGDCGQCQNTMVCECEGAFIVCSGMTGDCTQDGQCLAVKEFTSCDDGNPCTLGDKCAEDGLGPVCTYEETAQDGTPCNDGNVETPEDECLDGVCTGFEVVSGGCVPECGTKKCGDDGCGGDCGKCAVGEVCFGGGVCESDSDADGVADIGDNCPVAPNPGQENADGDNYGNACDCGPADASVHPNADEVCGNGKDDDCVGGDAACPPLPAEPEPITVNAGFGPFDYPYPVTDQAFCGLVKVYGKPCGAGCTPSNETVAGLQASSPIGVKDLGSVQQNDAGFPQEVTVDAAVAMADTLLFSIRHPDARQDGSKCGPNEVLWGCGPGKHMSVVLPDGNTYQAQSVEVSDGCLWKVEK